MKSQHTDGSKIRVVALVLSFLGAAAITFVVGALLMAPPLAIAVDPPDPPPDPCDPPPEGCCEKARCDEDMADGDGDGNPDGGGVICCDGQPVSCVLYSGPDDNDDGDDIIDACIIEHEDDHHDDITCPPGPGPTRPPYDDDKDPTEEECSAYAVELACLNGKLGDCNDQACTNKVQARINQVTQIRADLGC